MLVIETRLVEIVEFLRIDNDIEDVPVEVEDCVGDYSLVMTHFKRLLKHTLGIRKHARKSTRYDVIFRFGSVQLNDFDLPVLDKALALFRILVSQSFVNFAEMILVVFQWELQFEVASNFINNHLQWQLIRIFEHWQCPF